MAVKNQSTGLYEAKKTLSTGHEYVGVGSTKEEAKEDLAKQLKAIEIDYGPFQSDSQKAHVQRLIQAGKLPKYNPPMKKVGEMKSPGYEMRVGEDGRVQYQYNPNRVVPILAKGVAAPRSSRKDK